MSAAGPIKVLHVIDTLGMGGAETWLMELLRYWAQSGAVRSDFLLTSGNRGLFDDDALRLGARLHYIQFERRSLWNFARRFRGLLAEERYDVLHDHQDYASGLHFLMAGNLLPPRRVTHVHNPLLNIRENYGVSRLRRLTAKVGKRLVHRLASRICGTSSQALREYGFPPGQARPPVSVVHCGFDIARFGGEREPDRESVRREFSFPRQSKVVLFAGRLDRALEFDHPQNHKNSWFALNVVRAALRKDSSLRLLMAGAGDEQRGLLQQRVQDWGLTDSLRLIGVRRDIPRLMRAADLLLFPSRQEGLGMVAVEAQAAGLPVLASTAVPREANVIPELYKALSLTQTPEFWASALLDLVAAPRPSPDICQRVMEASDFSIAHSARRLEEIYTA